jgi:hypothetical protein
MKGVKCNFTFHRGSVDAEVIAEGDNFPKGAMDFPVINTIFVLHPL